MPPIMVFGMIQQRLDPGLHKAPCARIQRFLLTPHDRLRVGVLIQILAQLGPGEGVELFDTCDGDISAALGFAVLDEGGVDLA
jgi:hypothetical protein